MNKSELIERVAEAADLSKTSAAAAVDAMFDSIMSAVAKGDTAAFVGFGTFKATKRAARVGKNPKTGEALQIPESIAPKFTPGATFKVRVKA